MRSNISPTSFKKILFLCCFTSFFISCGEKVEDTSTKTETVTNNFVVDEIKKRTKTEILVCAHRAYHKYAPENSLASVQQAIQEGIDIVEVDVNTTKDGVLVLMHDNSIDRTTNGKGWISDLTFAELQKLHLTKDGVVTSHKIPTLHEVLTMAKGKIILNLDIKRVDVEKLYQQLKIHKMQNDVFSYIWDKRKIEKIIKIDSTYAVLPEVSTRADMTYYKNNVFSKLQHFNEKSFTNNNLVWAKENGIEVFMNSLWDVDKEFVDKKTAGMDKIIALKPAIIQTDYPVLLKDYLQSKGLHN